MKVTKRSHSKKNKTFLNSGAVISGSRMDLSNSESKPLKHRSNTTFVLPTSLTNDVSSLAISPSDPNLENNLTHSQQTVLSNRRLINGLAPGQSMPLSSYQAIEAVYREHGIRIHLDPATAANVSQQQQTTSTENLTGRKSSSSIQRARPFVYRTPSRSSSALNYSTVAREINDDSRPFSALQQTSTVEFVQATANDNTNASSQINNPYSTSSILTNERSEHSVLPLQLTNTDETTTVSSLIQNAPDLAYMSSLLQTTNGDLFRGQFNLSSCFSFHRNYNIYPF